MGEEKELIAFWIALKGKGEPQSDGKNSNAFLFGGIIVNTNQNKLQKIILVF